MENVSHLLVLEHRGMRLSLAESATGMQAASFGPYSEASTFNTAAFPPFQVAIAGRQHGGSPAVNLGMSDLPREMKLEDHSADAGRWWFRYKHPQLGLVVEVEMIPSPGAAVLRQVTRAINEGDAPITLTHLSSMSMPGVGLAGRLPWSHRDKFRVHYCRQAWAGEGQWREAGLEELGLFPTAVHSCRTSALISSVGSWSTGRYLPMAIIEDRESGQVWYFQIETSASWLYEIGVRGSQSQNNEAVFLHAAAANERHGGWTKTLLPGETFTAVPVAVGCCAGGFEEAVRELTKYRREMLKPANAWPGECPLVFNDYMNCLWGDPTLAKLEPLIATAGKVGAECFCIDAGWYEGPGLGDWQPSVDRFGEAGLAGILARIKSAGMIPGVWLEMEVCGEDSALGKRPDSWFLRRQGVRIGGGARWFLDFRNAEVRAYFHAVIDRLAAMGVGYIKNDYNECISLGDDAAGGSPGDGLLAHMQAFYGFIDEVRQRHSRLILENCGSGAMRQDYGALAHFHLQSTSDQESYWRYPSIITGTLAAVLPEQAGIWSYPYPLTYDRRSSPEILDSEAYRQKMADGEQTIFNMVNGLCGNLYMSGRIDRADPLNLELIRAGVALYKQERGFIRTAFPIWPTGRARIGDSEAWVSMGLSDEGNRRILLAVWRMEGDGEDKDISLPGWAGRPANIRQIYPGQRYKVDCAYDEKTGSVRVRFPSKYQARMFEITSIDQ